LIGSANQIQQWWLYCCFSSLSYWYTIITYIMEETDNLSIIYQDHRVTQFLEIYYNTYVHQASQNF